MRRRGDHPVSDVDERLIRFHLAMQEQDRARRVAARRRSDKTAPYVGTVVLILIAGVVLGAMTGRGGLAATSLLLLLGVALVHKMIEGEPRQSRVSMVRESALHVLAVECPECHAPINKRCTLPALDVRICHEARGRRYWQAADALAARTAKPTDTNDA
jgi:hypothetical protein